MSEPLVVIGNGMAAAKFCEEQLLPLNRSGDEEGCRYENGVVRTPKGFKEAYDLFAQGGWTGLAEFRAPELEPPKDRDFALLLGPLVDTEFEDSFAWEGARLKAELIVKGVLHPIRWACRESVNPDGSLTLRRNQYL